MSFAPPQAMVHPRNLMEEAQLQKLNLYEHWLIDEAVPVIRDFSVPDVRQLELGPWERKGGKGAVINLRGLELVVDAYVCEIPPGGSLKPQRHLYEETIFILDGSGASTVWNEGGSKRSFEWRGGSLFAPPLNTWHQHFNGSGQQPVRYLAVTQAPLFINLCNDLDFIFRNPFVFKSRFTGKDEFFSAKGKLYAGRVWESNFIPDVLSFQLMEWKERGARSSNIRFELSNNIMSAHVSEFPVGTYKKAHYGHGDAQLLILSGTGYTLIWPKDGGERVRIDWRAGTFFAPPDLWFHQHFNTGGQPARYLALHAGGSRKFTGVRREVKDSGVSVKKGGRQIEYEDEDPAIRRLFRAELARTGAPWLMAEFFPGE